MMFSVANHRVRPDDEDRRLGCRWSRRIGPAVAVAALSIGLLAGCGGSSSSTSSSPTDGGSTATTAPTSSSSSADTSDSSSSDSSGGSSSANDAAFVSQMQTQQDWQGISSDNLTKLGNGVCTDFQQGVSLSSVEQDAVQGINEINTNDEEAGNEAVLTDHDAGYLIGAAVKNLCPQYLGQLPSS